MEHFVAYQNSDVQRPFSDRPVRVGRRVSWFTAKRFREETLVDNRLWAFEGLGSPKCYRLVRYGIVTHLTRAKRPAPFRGTGLNVHFRVDTDIQPIDVTDRPWFKRLLKQQQSFRHGLCKITDRRVIAALDALLGDGLPTPKLRFRKDPP